MSVYEKDQLVWAKVKGYAWWPAIVAKSNTAKNGEIEKEIQVNFIGETTHAAVSQDKIANFQEKFKEHSKTKTKKLQEAIKLAQGIQGDESIANTQVEEKADRRSASKGRRNGSQQQKEVEEVPQKKTRGRPKKNLEVTQISESAPQARRSKSRTTKKEETKEAPVEPKSRRGRAKKQEKKDMEIEEAETDKSQGKRGGETSARKSRSKTGNKDGMEVEPEEEVSITPAPRRGRKAATNKNETSVATPVTSRSKSKKQEEESVPPRVGRSNRRKTNEIITEPAVASARKGRRSTSSKQSVDASPKPDSLPPRPTSTEILSQKPAEPQFKAPAMKLRQPQSEKPQERNLLRSINAEPNMSTPIQVTVRKSAGKKAISSAIAAKIGEKRSSSFWLKDLAAPHYSTNLKAKEIRATASEIIVKKVKMSPCLQQKLTSVKGTSLKEIQKPRNNIMKAMLAYNSLMIRKFESDLEQILLRISSKFKDREVLLETDYDHVKLANILVEFEKSQFNGSEFISSEVGKLFKTILRLFVNNKNLLNNSTSLLIAGLTRVIHQIKEKIIRFCMDNSSYTDNFDLSGDSELLMEIENLDASQMSSRSGARFSSEERLLRRDIRKDEEASISSRGNSGFKGEEASENSSNFGSESKQPMNLIMRNQTFNRFGKLFQDIYFIDKTGSESSALQLEDLLSRCYHHFFTDYKQAAQVIEQFIEKEKFTAEEVLKFKDMDLGSFKAFLRAKRREVGDFSSMGEGLFKKEGEERGRRRVRDDSLDGKFGLEEKRRTSVSKGLESIL